jgi:hypothetical protein
MFSSALGAGPRESAKVARFGSAVDKHYLEGERGVIGRVLATVGPKDERVIAALSKVLRNPKESNDVRGGLAFRLSQMGEPGQAIIPDLMQILKETSGKKKDNDADSLRQEVLLSLCNLKLSKKEIPALLDIIGDKEERDGVREFALYAIGNSANASEAAWGPLIRVLSSEDEREVNLRKLRITAIDLLGKLPAPAGTDRKARLRELEQAFMIVQRYDNDPGLRQAMMITLKQYGGP